MAGIWDQIVSGVASYAPRILGALAILVVGWLVALAISAGVRALLRRTELDDRLLGWIRRDPTGAPADASKPISKVLYYILMLFVLVAFFQGLGLTLITEPLNNLLNEVFTFAPKLLGAVLLLVVALIVATVLRKILSRGLEGVGVDRRFQEKSGVEGDTQVPLSKSLADTVYWLILLLFLPAILGALGLTGLLAPVQQLVNEILGYLPNILAAAIVLFAGWFVARIVQRIVTNLLAAAGADRLSERVGLASALGQQKLSGTLGIIVYALIFIPVLIGALNALELEALTTPASQMLDTILNALPSIFAAVLVVLFSLVVGRVVARLVVNLLQGIGFDQLPARLGLVREGAALRHGPSAIVGTVVLVGIMLFAATEAANLLGFDVVADLVGQFMVFAGHLLFGIVILAVGLFLANLAASAVRATGTARSPLLATAARASVIVLSVAMALRHMGLADEIINLAFGLLLGAVAVAVAIAFGIGGRDAAARQIEGWQRSMKASDDATRNR